MRGPRQTRSLPVVLLIAALAAGAGVGRGLALDAWGDEADHTTIGDPDMRANALPFQGLPLGASHWDASTSGSKVCLATSKCAASNVDRTSIIKGTSATAMRGAAG